MPQLRAHGRLSYGRTRRASLAVAALAASGALSFSGCKVGPDYDAPRTEDQVLKIGSTGTPEVEAAGITSAIPVVRDWWGTLGDKRIEPLVDALVNGNLDLKTAQARVREARALRGVAVGPLYPSVNINGDVGVVGPNVKSSKNNLHGGIAYNSGVGTGGPNTGVIWEIDAWGGLRRAVEVADANLEAAVESRRDTLVLVLSELGTNYVTLRGQQRQLAIALRNVALQEKTLALETTLKTSGLASDLQVAQAASQLESTRAVVPTLLATIARSIYIISVLVGREPSALTAELTDPGPVLAAPPTIPVGLPSELLVRRPDIRNAERAMAAACAQVGVATADLYPKFALTGTVTYSSAFGLPGQPSYFVGPTVSWPIFNGFAIVNNIKVQDARLEEAVLAYRTAILAAFEQVEDGLTTYAQELVRRDTLARAANRAERAAALAETQYKSGLVDFLNVLTAEGTQAASELALAASEQLLLTDLIAIYKALGGGWDVFEEKLAHGEQQDSNTAPSRKPVQDSR